MIYFYYAKARVAESWWGCFDSETDSELLIGSDSGSDTKYKTNNALIVKQVFAVQAKKQKQKKNMTSPIDFGFHSFGQKIFILVIPYA